MEIQSKYIRKDVLHFESNVESQEFIDSIESRSAMGNIFRVQFPTAMGTHALYRKHMSSIGCPWWCDYIATYCPPAIDVCITCFPGSDGGPDDMGAKEQAMYESMLGMNMDDMGAEGVGKLRENGENGGPAW